ncbi:hypothetical protein [Candidatus Nitrospira bockiana]
MSDAATMFTPEELRLIRDEQFFPAKARIMKKVRGLLEQLHRRLQAELSGVDLLAPPGFDPAKHQFVKGEHLEDFPYQYLDFPKHFDGGQKFTFRTLFWWGHHFTFAWILEGDRLLEYKQNLINRYHAVAGQDLTLSLGPSPWEWNTGEGYTLPLTHDRKSQVSAVLSGRSFFKLGRFVAHDDPLVAEGRVVDAGVQAFRALLPVVRA